MAEEGEERRPQPQQVAAQASGLSVGVLGSLLEQALEALPHRDEFYPTVPSSPTSSSVWQAWRWLGQWSITGSTYVDLPLPEDPSELRLGLIVR